MGRVALDMGGAGTLVTAVQVRAVALSLPRTSEHLIRDYVKFRVGKIVYVSISPDELTMGFGFPREERAALIAAEPGKFAMPRLSDQRFGDRHGQPRIQRGRTCRQPAHQHRLHDRGAAGKLVVRNRIHYR